MTQSATNITSKLTFSVSGIDSDKRLGELIVYIAQKCAGDSKFGAIKLNKILYFSDFLSYLKTGKPITGAAYQKLPQGPAPKRLVPVRESLIKESAIEPVEMVYCGFMQKRVLAKRQPNLSVFSASDIAQVDEVIELLSRASAKGCSEFSHNIAWKIAGPKGQIPYESVFLSDEEATDEDVAWAKGLAKEYSWNV